MLKLPGLSLFLILIQFLPQASTNTFVIGRKKPETQGLNEIKEDELSEINKDEELDTGRGGDAVGANKEGNSTNGDVFEDEPFTNSELEGEIIVNKTKTSRESASLSTLNQSNTIEDNELANAHIDKDINDFEELKAKINLLEIHLRQIADFNNVEDEDLVETDKILKAIDIEVIEPYEDKLRALKSQVMKSNLELEDEFRSSVDVIVKNAEISLQTSREKLDDVEELEQMWENAEKAENIEYKTEEETGDNLKHSAAIQTEDLNSYDQFNSKNINDKHNRGHEDETSLALVNAKINEAAETLYSSTVDYSSLHPSLTPGLTCMFITMLVFLLMCSAVAYKLSRKRRATNRLVSQVMARDLGYTELETVGERKKWDSMGEFNGQHKLK